jgi:hypothetical protein
MIYRIIHNEINSFMQIKHSRLKKMQIFEIHSGTQASDEMNSVSFFRGNNAPKVAKRAEDYLRKISHLLV